MDIGIVPNQTVPASVYRVLLPHEHKNLVITRFHPAVVIRPVAEALGGLALAALLSTIARLNEAALLVIWLLWGILLLRLLFAIFNWLEDYFVVTKSRLLVSKGVIRKSVNMMPLTKVTDMRFERSPMGRILGYGTFIVESAGQDQALRQVDKLPYPEQLYLEVCGLIFKGPDTDD